MVDINNLKQFQKQLQKIEPYLTSDIKREVVYKLRTTDATMSRYLSGEAKDDVLAEKLYNELETELRAHTLRVCKFLNIEPCKEKN